MTLTPYEKATLVLISYGWLNEEISRFFGVSHRTVKNRISVMLHKLGAQNRTEAAMWTWRNGLNCCKELRAGDELWN
jgi:DNA-binding NarL/FixJ family response regulator